MSTKQHVEIDRHRLKHLLERERKQFAAEHPESKRLFERAKQSMLGGVPMQWMIRWSSPYPVFVKEGQGQYFWDVDGKKYIDFCLGDTGSMTGHTPKETTNAIVSQLQKGITFMLPSEDSIIVGEELKKRFGLPYWQIAMTATDANRFSIRLCRHITGRKKILVFNWSYHGTVDEVFATLDPRTKQVRPRVGNVGYPVDPSVTTKVVEFNDLKALEAALKDRDVACVLAEPAMTNIGIIHPIDGYWEKATQLCRNTGTLLIIDETHTICTSPGGYTKTYNLQPDMFVIGKPIGSGVPCAAYGFSERVAKIIQDKTDVDTIDTSGIGGTLTGNALAMAAMRATLQNMLDDAAFKKTVPLAVKFTDDVQKVIDEFKLPWSITRLGCRAEYWFRAARPMNGGQAAAASDVELDTFMHLYCLNRGILMTPFHNMALIAPTTTVEDIEHHTRVFRSAVEELLAPNNKPSSKL